MKTFEMDNPLLEFVSKDGRVPFSMRMACEGFGVTGSIGSGKSSGSARFIAMKMLEQGLSGLVLTAKTSEKDEWIEYCRLTGRENDLIILEPGGDHRFNFMDYLGSHTTGTGLTENIVEVLKTVIESGQPNGSGGTNDSFWSDSLTMVLFFSVQLCKFAYGTVSVEILYEICQSLPKTGVKIRPEENCEPSAFYKAYSTALQEISKKIDIWESLFNKKDLAKLHAENRFFSEMYRYYPEIRQFKQMDDFFLNTFRNLADKTRSIVDFTISSFLFRFLQEPVFSLFCSGKSTVTPEMCTEGKIILVNMPILEYHKIGRDCQILVKLLFQRAMQKRTIEEHTEPVFLYADEAQLFLHPLDTDFQATARSSRIINCFITQNLPNLFVSMGGDRAEYRVKAFLSTLGTKIFHSNTCVDTNTYSSNLIGEAFMLDYSQTVSYSQQPSESRGKTLKLQKIMRSEDFIDLKTGGKLNNCLVEGIVHCQGNAKFFGQSFLKVNFFQNYQPKQTNPNHKLSDHETKLISY